jgi:hypothetical protein
MIRRRNGLRPKSAISAVADQPKWVNCMAVDWAASERHRYIVVKHGVTREQANETLDDPDAVEFDPDYNSKPGPEHPHRRLLAQCSRDHHGDHRQRGWRRLCDDH